MIHTGSLPGSAGNAMAARLCLAGRRNARQSLGARTNKVTLDLPWEKKHHLVPKLLFGNAHPPNSVWRATSKQSIGKCVPKQEFGNEVRRVDTGPSLGEKHLTLPSCFRAIR